MKISVGFEEDNIVYYSSHIGSIPFGMYSDKDNDVVLINTEGQVALLVLVFSDGSTALSSYTAEVAWPIAPMPPGSKLEFTA